MTSADSFVALACASNQSIFLAGTSGPVWRVVEGVVRLDRDCGPIRQPVQLALPGDLIGAEVLCGQPYQLSASAFTRCRVALLLLAGSSQLRRRALPVPPGSPLGLNPMVAICKCRPSSVDHRDKA